MARQSSHAQRVEQAIAGSGAAQSALVASWRRSAHLHRLDAATHTRPERLTHTEFRTARDRMGGLIRMAQPRLDQLIKTVGSMGCCVLLADRDGVPLERRGAAGDDADFAGWGLWTGTRWSEADQGTNGIGTCLAEERAVIIHRDQHFLARNTGLTCLTAPVYDASGGVAGALDVSSARGGLNGGVTALIAEAVSGAARQIETDLFRAQYAQQRILVLPDAPPGPVALLAVDHDDLVIGATRAARRSLRLPEDLAAHPVVAGDLLDLSPRDGLPDAERGAILRALARAGGNRSQAARKLGISRATLHRKLSSPPKLSQN